MATAAPARRAIQTTGGRLAAWLPGVLLALWAAGAVGVWYAGQRLQWSPGTLVLVGCAWVLVLAAVARDAVRGMFGPVFTYEITRLGRRRLTFILRLLYVLGMMGLLALMYLTWLDDVGYFRRGGLDRVPSERLSSFANKFFYAFVSVQYLVVGFLTPAYVAGTVADEKERKTLEFLLATDLRNREIIFGKVAARVTNLLMFVLAGLPVVAFLQLFGGIDPDQLIAATAATVVTVLGLSALSVAFSVALKRPRDAIALTYLAAAVYFVGSFALAMYVLYLQFTLTRTGATPYQFLGFEIDPVAVLNTVREGTDWLAAGNAPYVIISSSVPSRSGGVLTAAALGTALFRYAMFWGAVTALFLGYSVWRLRAVALNQAYGAPKQARGGRMGRAAKVRPGVGDDPMFWKEVFVEGGVRGGCAGWLLSLAIAGLVFMFPVIFVYNIFIDPPTYGGVWTTARKWTEFTELMNGWVRGVTGVLGFLVMLSAAVRGAAVVSGERDRDTWVSLMATPLTAWEMLRAKWLGCVLGQRRAYLVLFLVWGLALAVGAVDPPMILVAVLYLAVFVSAFAWIGIYCSITARTTLIATVRALMASLFVAGGFWVAILFCCVMPLNIVADRSQLDALESVGYLLLGCTPPFVLGWLPLMEYGRHDLGVFSWEERHSLGPLNPVFGFFVWFGANWVLGLLSWQAFKRVTNRARDVLADRLPRPRRPLPDGKPLPGRPAVTRPARRPPADEGPGEEPIISE